MLSAVIFDWGGTLSVPADVELADMWVLAATSEMTHTKPHSEAFRTVLAELGITDPSTAVFVGDRPYDDIYGAKQFGLRTVLRQNHLVPGFDVEPDASITSLTELVSIVEAWSDTVQSWSSRQSSTRSTIGSPLSR